MGSLKKSLLLFVLLIVVLMPSTAQTAQTEPFAQFKLNDNLSDRGVYDETPAHNTGVASDNTSAFSIAGKINNAFSFNGINQSVDMVNLLNDIHDDTEGTFSMWVKPVNANGAILSFTGQGGSFSIDWYKGNQSANFSISGAGTPISCTTSPGSMPANVFSHLVITQNGTQFKIYLNGVEQTITSWYDSAPGAWFSFLNTSVTNARLGSTIYQGTEYYFQGSIDDLRYYKKALSNSEVLSIYNNGAGTEETTPAIPMTPMPDTAVPTVPSGLTAANITQTTLTLNWTISTDNVAVTGYKVFKDGTRIGTPATNTFSVTGLTAATQYSFKVSANDAAGNNSALSSALSISTLAAPDITAPSVPVGLAASDITQNSLTLNWTPSTDDVAVVYYKIYKNGTLIGTSSTNRFEITSLSASTAYSLAVSAIDGAGNNSTQSTAKIITTLAPIIIPVNFTDITSGLEGNEAKCSASGWKKIITNIDGNQRQVLWKGPTTPWKGSIIVMHGGGGDYTQWCYTSVPAVKPQVDFSNLAVFRGFGVFLIDSTNDVVTDANGLVCGKRFDATVVDGRSSNIDLPLIERVIKEIIPAKRTNGSGLGIFMAGESIGGYMTTRAATHFDGLITAFAPAASGDPYGIYFDCNPALSPRTSAKGAGYDRETNKQIIEVDACVSDIYPNEKEWETMSPIKKPVFKTFHSEDDGIADLSCRDKVAIQLRNHGYPDDGAFIIPGTGVRSIAAHFWQGAYNTPLLDFFERSVPTPTP